MARPRGNPVHGRVTASKIEGARDWLITFHDKKDKKRELVPFKDQKAGKSQLHTRLTLEQARRALWRAQYINAGVGKTCRLWLFTGGSPEYVAVEDDDIPEILEQAKKEKTWEGIPLAEYGAARESLKRLKRERVR